MLLLGLLLVTVPSAPALAADEHADPADDLPEIALRLSPAVLEVADGPGPSRHDLRVDNLGSEPLQVVTHLSDFTVTEDGTTRFLGPDELSATTWATLDVDTFELAPGERRDVALTVEVPDDAEPGERYLSAIFAVPGEADGGGNISVTHRVAVKLYIAVAGERIENLDLGELSGPRLIDGGPARFELTVANRGNVHRRFEEDTQLLATHGDNQFAFENFTVLGQSTRVAEAIWPDPPMLCWCTVQVEDNDGQGRLVTASTRVIAFPWRLSLALLALTGGLALLVIGRRGRRRAKPERPGAPSDTSLPGMQPPPAPLRPEPPVPPVHSGPLVHAHTGTAPGAEGAPELRAFGTTVFTARGPRGPQGHRGQGRRRR